jgi:hypothetical protein
MSEADTQELHIESPLSPKTPPESPQTPLPEELNDEEVALAEEVINKEYDFDVRLNFVQFFALKHPYTYNDFLMLRDVCYHGGFQLHTMWKLGRERSLSIDCLKRIFGENAKFIYNITDDDLEHFRQQILKHYNITYCRCGCTALMMDCDRLSKFRIGWDHFTDYSANAVCGGQNVTGPINRACRRRLRTIQYLRELEQRDEAALNLTKPKSREHKLSTLAQVAESINTIEAANNNQTGGLEDGKTQTCIESMECVDDNATNNFTIDSQAIVD